MTPSEIIRAWKDEEYRMSLSESDRAALPAHPAGIVELSDEELSGVAGGFMPSVTCTTGGICITIFASCFGTCSCTNGDICSHLSFCCATIIQ